MCTSAYWPPSRELSLPRFYSPLHAQRPPACNGVVSIPPPSSAASRPMSAAFPIGSGGAPQPSMPAFAIQDPHQQPSRYPTGQHLEAMFHKTSFHPDLSLMEKQQQQVMAYKLPWQHVEERFGAMSKLQQHDADGNGEEDVDGLKSTGNKEGHLDDKNKLLSHCRILKIKGKNLISLMVFHLLTN